MIKNIFLVLLLLLVAWLSRDYFTIILPENEKSAIGISPYASQNNPKTIQLNKQNLTVSNANVKRKPAIENSKESKENNPLAKLLYQNKFYDALAYYLEHTTENNMHLIEAYLAAYAKSHPHRALSFMQVFLDDEPQSNMLSLMIETELALQAYPNAIKHMMQARDSYKSEAEDKRLAKLLKNTAIHYIESLNKSKNFDALITFLEEMIAYDNQESYYPFSLAQLYIGLDKNEEAASLLSELEYDEVYAQKVKSMIASIEITDDVENQYDYAIPLDRYGQHYVVNLFLDGVAFRLMLDTGATYIYLDDDKASSLEILNPHLRLQTAGGDIHAKLRIARHLQVGELQLDDIQVTTAVFKREGIDGLLGMNFLNKFAFFIDQESDTLYLTVK